MNGPRPSKRTSARSSSRAFREWKHPSSCRGDAAALVIHYPSVLWRMQEFIRRPANARARPLCAPHGGRWIRIPHIRCYGHVKKKEGKSRFTGRADAPASIFLGCMFNLLIRMERRDPINPHILDIFGNYPRLVHQERMCTKRAASLTCGSWRATYGSKRRRNECG